MKFFKLNWRKILIWLGAFALISAIIYSTYLSFISTRPHPQIGISVAEVRDASSAERYRVTDNGVYITVVHITPSGENASLHEGDRLISIAGKNISRTTDITKMVLKHKIGDVLNITVKRDGKEMEVSVTLTKQIKGLTDPFDPATP